jgi:hypothetical protein
MGDAVKVLLCVDLVFTLPIVMTAPRELLEDMLLPRGGGGGGGGDGSADSDGNSTTKQVYSGVQCICVWIRVRVLLKKFQMRSRRARCLHRGT